MFEGYVEDPICKRHISLVKRPNYQDRSVSELILDFGPGFLDFWWGREKKHIWNRRKIFGPEEKKKKGNI